MKSTILSELDQIQISTRYINIWNALTTDATLAKIFSINFESIKYIQINLINKSLQCGGIKNEYFPNSRSKKSDKFSKIYCQSFEEIRGSRDLRYTKYSKIYVSLELKDRRR